MNKLNELLEIEGSTYDDEVSFGKMFVLFVLLIGVFIGGFWLQAKLGGKDVQDVPYYRNDAQQFNQYSK